jgi:hypothetical protein
MMSRIAVVFDKMRDVTVERQQGRKLAATGTRKSKGPTGLYGGCTKVLRLRVGLRPQPRSVNARPSSRTQPRNVVCQSVSLSVVHAALPLGPDSLIFPPFDIPTTLSVRLGLVNLPVGRTSPHPDGPRARRISNAGPIRAPGSPRGGHIEQDLTAQCRLLDEAGRHAILPARRPPSPEFFLHQILITAHSVTTTNPRRRFFARSMAQTHPWSS